MKLGMAFNVFSGLDVLKPALRNARPFAHTIVVVYQLVSNRGHVAPSYAERLLEDLKKEGLIDILQLYTPKLVSKAPEEIQENNRSKREIGRLLCVERGCNFFMCRDCDEFYVPSQFKEALNHSVQYDMTLCRLLDYVHSPLYISRKVSPTYVPFIHKIQFGYGVEIWKGLYRGLLVDPARVVTGASRVHVFPVKLVVMHHMGQVRYGPDEFSLKIKSHSCWDHYSQAGFVDRWARCRSQVPNPKRYRGLERDQFGVLEYWKQEFPQYLKVKK